MPRSGTKLLRELLNRHPRIAIPDVETEFLPWLAHRVHRFGNLANRKHFENLYRHLGRQSFFVYRTQAGRTVSAEVWHSACRSFDAAGLFEALIRLDISAPFESDRIWGDKSPSYIDDLPLIGSLFPNARIVHIVRDVRDYCVSVNRAWGKDMRRAAHRWALGVSAARRDGYALGSSYLEVTYEGLLSDPKSTMVELCEFLGVDFTPDMLTLVRPSENIGEARGACHVVVDNHGKFMAGMDVSTLAEVEQIAGRAMDDFGYRPTLPPRQQHWSLPLRVRLAQLHDALQLLRNREGGRGFFESLLFHLRYFGVTRG